MELMDRIRAIGKLHESPFTVSTQVYTSENRNQVDIEELHFGGVIFPLLEVVHKPQLQSMFAGYLLSKFDLPFTFTFENREVHIDQFSFKFNVEGTGTSANRTFLEVVLDAWESR